MTRHIVVMGECFIPILFSRKRHRIFSSCALIGYCFEPPSTYLKEFKNVSQMRKELFLPVGTWRTQEFSKDQGIGQRCATTVQRGAVSGRRGTGIGWKTVITSGLGSVSCQRRAVIGRSSSVAREKDAITGWWGAVFGRIGTHKGYCGLSQVE